MSFSVGEHGFRLLTPLVGQLVVYITYYPHYKDTEDADAILGTFCIRRWQTRVGSGDLRGIQLSGVRAILHVGKPSCTNPLENSNPLKS